MGGSTEDQDCDPENKERERPANAVPGDEETSSQLEFNSEGEDVRAFSIAFNVFSWNKASPRR